ncbi:MAG TPA: flagellar hook-basal body complex protein FliE [Planctomycetaceae bacterium]
MPAPVTSSPFTPPVVTPLAPALPEDTPTGPTFSDLLAEAVGRGAALQTEADLTVMHALAGGDVTQVEVLSAVKKADLALRMMLQVRNKLLDAYNEIQQIRF